MLSKVFLADDAVLAENAAQITSAKKNCSRTFRAADTGLLPKMQRRSSNHRLNRHAAISFALLPIRQTSSWAQATSFPFPLFRLLIFLFHTALPVSYTHLQPLPFPVLNLRSTLIGKGLPRAAAPCHKISSCPRFMTAGHRHFKTKSFVEIARISRSNKKASGKNAVPACLFTKMLLPYKQGIRALLPLLTAL